MDSETKTFRILLNASYLGKYYLPGIQAEAMYNNDYSVRTKGQWVEVVQWLARNPYDSMDKRIPQWKNVSVSKVIKYQ